MPNSFICGRCDDCFELKDKINKNSCCICTKDGSKIDEKSEPSKECPYILEHIINRENWSEKTITEEMLIYLDQRYKDIELERFYDE